MSLQPLDPPPSPWRRWGLVWAGVLLSGAVLTVDLARPTLLDPVRQQVATTVAPITSALTGWSDTRITELTRERNELAARVTELEAAAALQEDLVALEQAATWGSAELVPARVVGFSQATSPVGGRSVTLDVGSGDGVHVDQTVIDVDGLVGRVVRVDERSCDVLLLGDADVVVGVRFGEDGTLGSVQAVSPDQHRLPARGPGELTLTALGDGAIAVGDEVTTLGSPDSTPYAAGIPLGRVIAVDPPSGQLGATAVVQPHMNPDALDLVAVVFPHDTGDSS